MRTAHVLASAILPAALALAGCARTTQNAQPQAPTTAPGSHTTDIDTTGPSGLGSPSGFGTSTGDNGQGGDTSGSTNASGTDDTAPVEPGLAQPQPVDPRLRPNQPSPPPPQTEPGNTTP